MTRKHRFNPGAVALALAALLAAAPTQAQQAYVGASAGLSRFEVDTAGASSSDTSDVGYKLYGGALFGEHFGVEAALFDLGKASGSGTLPGFGPVGVSAKVRGASLAGLASLPLGDASVFAKAGVAYVRASVDATVAGQTASASESSLQPMVGVGASYAITPQVAARIEWERVRVRYPGETAEYADLVSAGLAWRF
jgi:opacity protein-like surface antigen